MDILKDLSEESPAGISLKYDVIYDEIKLAMQEDDPRLPQGVWETDFKKADWDKVQQLCETALTNTTKDFQLVIWLIEAYITKNEWMGLAHGLDLLLQFSKKFWDIAFPKLDDDIEYRLAPFIYLSHMLSNKIVFLPLSNPQNDLEKNPVSDFINASAQINSNTQAETFNKIRKAQEVTDDMFFIYTQHFIQKAIFLIEELDDFLTQKTNNLSPSFSQAITIFKTINVDFLSILNNRNLKQWPPEEENYTPPQAPEIIPEEPVQPPEEQDEPDSTQEDNDSPLSQATVEQAYDAIYQIASFLEEKQPQSLSPALLRVIIFLKDKSFTEISKIRTKDGESILNYISKICEIMQ